MTTKRCDHCKVEKDITEFNWNLKALGIRHDTCRECMKWFVRRYFKGSAHDEHLKNVKERKKAARIAAREYVWNYLTTHPCEKCGESDPRVLDFITAMKPKKKVLFPTWLVRGTHLSVFNRN